MKKAENLNSSLFQKFEGDRINNLARCMGGTRYTTYDKETHKAVDCADTGSHTGGTTIDGEPCDWYKAPC
jgi:hypothetical protein